MDQVGEEWKPVVGYEGWYEISNVGRVKRVARGRGTKRPILSPSPMKIGYLQVTLSYGMIETRRKRYVHDLVAAAFIGPRPPGHQVNHIDGNKLNNRVENLEYVTHAGNARHAVRIGLTKPSPRLLTEEQVREVRRLKQHMSYRKIAALYGVSFTVIWFAVNPERRRSTAA